MSNPEFAHHEDQEQEWREPTLETILAFNESEEMRQIRAAIREAVAVGELPLEQLQAEYGRYQELGEVIADQSPEPGPAQLARFGLAESCARLLHEAGYHEQAVSALTELADELIAGGYEQQALQVEQLVTTIAASETDASQENSG